LGGQIVINDNFTLNDIEFALFYWYSTTVLCLMLLNFWKFVVVKNYCFSRSWLFIALS